MGNEDRGAQEPSQVEVRMGRREAGGGERLGSEEHALLHMPGTVPITVPGAVPTHLTSYPSNPGRWIVIPFHR